MAAGAGARRQGLDQRQRRIAERRPGQGAAFNFVFAITTTRSPMTEIGQSPGTRNALRRDRLPNRRPAETVAFEHAGTRYRATIGFFPAGNAGEVFLNHDRSDSLLDALASDAAILVSICLQHGAALQD